MNKNSFPALYRFLARLRLKLSRDFIFTLPSGALMRLNKYSYVERLIAQGDFESTRSKCILDKIHPNTVFVDIGANVGFYTVLASSTCGVVHAFEPDPTNFDRLQANASLNRNQGKAIHLYNFALGRELGTALLNRPLTDNYGMATFSTLAKADSVEVPIKRLDGLLEIKPQHHLFKVDVEGFELEVLAGCEGIHARLVPGSTWLVEIHTGVGIEPAKVANYFSTNGYDVSYVDDATGEYHQEPSSNGDPWLCAVKR
jgi:FkbM family methyltransferase